MGVSSRGIAVRPGLVSDPAPASVYFGTLSSCRRICILAAFTIYVSAGREIFKKRRQLRSFNNIDDDQPFSAVKTTDVQVTSELVSLPREDAGPAAHDPAAKTYEAYSVNIAASIPMSPRHPMNPRSDRPVMIHGSSMSSMHIRNRIAVEANTAARGYTKVALLFFISLLVTWVSDMFRSSRGFQVSISFHSGYSHDTWQAPQSNGLLHSFHPPSTAYTRCYILHLCRLP